MLIKVEDNVKCKIGTSGMSRKSGPLQEKKVSSGQGEDLLKRPLPLRPLKRPLFLGVAKTLYSSQCFSLYTDTDINNEYACMDTDIRNI